MIIHPETVADRGCWISHDRVYAFVSSAIDGIAEIGYHGTQPVSRNARIFASTSGVCRFAASAADGVWHQLVFEEFDWLPALVRVRASCPVGNIRFEINTSGKSITITGSEVNGPIKSLVVQLDMHSLNTEVHGQRTWKVRSGQPGWMRYQCRDQIILKEWMKREGPYGSDFLIPEPLRRRIFRTRVRSGLATPADLLPEFQNSPLSIYDAEVHVEVGGEGYDVDEKGDLMLFTTAVTNVPGCIPPFSICFDQNVDPPVQATIGGTSAATLMALPERVRTEVPTISIPGFENIERFFSTVPGLVESCIVRDYGIPRATPGGYYWIWAWDAMVTALVSLRWGATEVAGRTAAFVQGNRDIDGCIPMRWTHTLEPLDSQPRGALETLLASLSYALAREKHGEPVLPDIYPHIVKHLEEVTGHCDSRGLFTNMGFYPDLPLHFGRTERSSVALEVAAFYAFCRTCENCAMQMGDERTTQTAQKMITMLEHSFSEVFWDKRRGFFVDAVERDTGTRNKSYPLFSLLFLHHPPALQLIRGHLAQAADFITKHLLTPVGMRLMPTWDRNAESETVSGSWYPHWDAYAIKLFRRAGYSAEIVTWLGSVELALERLGYAPEYLVLDPSLTKDPAAWRRHGSASNLNCATGWYQALLEGVLGLEFDPGGLTIVPLALPLPETSIRGVHHLGTRWNVTARQDGPLLESLRVDGEVIPGCLKVPKRFHDGSEHAVEIHYSKGSGQPRLLELANAEVLELASSSKGIEAEINGLGRVGLGFFAPREWDIFIDGKNVDHTSGRGSEPRFFSLPISGRHTIHISSGKAG